VLAGKIYLELNDPSRAQSEIEKAIAENPLSPGLYYLMGKINEKESQFSDAVMYLKKALYLDSSFALAHFGLAVVYEKLGKNEMALKQFENAKTYLEKNAGGKSVKYTDDYKPELLMTECKKSIIRLSGGITTGGVLQ
jgi:Tfp pilus assembly protein PilF